MTPAAIAMPAAPPTAIPTMAPVESAESAVEGDDDVTAEGEGVDVAATVVGEETAVGEVVAVGELAGVGDVEVVGEAVAVAVALDCTDFM